MARKPKEGNEAQGWDWFQPRAIADDTDELALNFTRCFTAAAGQAVLAHLENIFVMRALPMGSSAQDLSYAEGQRSAVVLIKNLIARGANS